MILMKIKWYFKVPAIIFILVIGISFGSTTFIKAYFNEHSKELIGREARIESLYNNIFTGYIQIDGFEIKEADNSTEFVSFKSLAIDIDYYKLIGKEIKIHFISIDELDAHIIQNGSSFNFTDLLTSDTTQEESNNSFSFAIEDIQLIHSNIDYTDTKRNAHWDIDDLNLDIPKIHFSGASTNVDLSFKLNDGGEVKSKLAYDIETGVYHIDLGIKQFKVEDIFPYLHETINIEKGSGLFYSDLHIAGNNTGTQLGVSGTLGLKDVDIYSNNKTFAQLEHFEVVLDTFELATNTLIIEKVMVNKPIFDYTQITKKRTNITEFLQDPKSDNTNKAADTSKAPFNLLVKDFQLQNGRSVYTDLTQTMFNPIHVKHLNCNAQNVQLDSSIQVDVNLDLEKGGSIQTNTLIDLKEHFLSTNLKIKNLNSEYAEPYVLLGLDVDSVSGSFNCNLNATVDYQKPDVDANGWVALDNVYAQSRSDYNSFGAFKKLFVQIDTFDLSEKKLWIKDVHLDQAKFDYLQYSKSSSTVTSLLKKKKNQAIKKKKKKGKKPFDLFVKNFEMENAVAVYHDFTQKNPQPINVSSLNYSVSDFSLKNTSNIQLNIQLEDDGNLDITTTLNIKTGDLNSSVKLENISASHAKPYLSKIMDLELLQGKINSNLNSKINFKQLDIVADGTVDLEKIRIKSNRDQQKIATLKRVGLHLRKFDLKNKTLLLDTVKIDNLDFNFNNYKDSTNSISRLLVAKKSSQSPKKDTSSKKSDPFNLLVNKFILSNSNIHYSDAKWSKPVKYNIKHLNIQGDHVHLTEPSQWKLKADLQNKGELSLKANGTLTSIEDLYLTLSIRHADLKPFTPYTEDLFGYPILDGSLDFTSINTIQDFQLDGQNELNTTKVELGDKRQEPSQMNLPLKMGLYLMEDSKKRVKINMPVKGNVRDPEFSYEKLIVKAFVNVFSKVATSPINLVSRSLGSDVEKVKRIDFKTDQYDLNNEQKDRLDIIGSIAKQKPELKFVLTQKLNWDKELSNFSTLLAKGMFVKKEGRSKDSIFSQDEIESALRVLDNDEKFNKYIDKQLSKEERNRSINQKAQSLYSEKELLAYFITWCNRRNNQVRNYLIEKNGLDPENLEVVTASIEELKKYAGKPHYSVELKME